MRQQQQVYAEQGSKMVANKVREITRLLGVLRTKKISKWEALHIIDELEYAFNSIVEQTDVKPETESYRDLAEQLSKLTDMISTLAKQSEDNPEIRVIAARIVDILKQKKASLLEDKRSLMLLRRQQRMNESVATRSGKLLEALKRRL